MVSAAFVPSIDQAELRFLVDKNADGIIVVDEDGIVLFANPAAEKIFGRAAEALFGSPIGIPLVSGETTEIAIHKPGGGQIDAEIRVVDTRWGHGAARLASVRDISARKVIEERLRHASKMEAIGRLTAGIAHDFNNLLTVVLGNLEHAQRRVEDRATLNALDNAMRGARRAAVLTERLLAFARRRPLEPRRLNANAVVSGMSDLLHRTLGEDVTVHADLAVDLWPIEVDPTGLETAILNLIVNARDAMPAGGKVSIETANVELDVAYAASEVEVRPGAYVLIAVADTGMGMPPEVLRQVFEPFFTTKSDGRGTGLGLSQVYGFVRQSGGHVKLHSEPGQGTTAKIYLPKVECSGAAEPKVKAPSDRVALARPDETILVVEDDQDVRAFAVNSLRGLGYTVFEAADAASALRILVATPAIRLLFTDLGLPGGMDGKALAARAQELSRDLKVLITTAYAGNTLIHEGRLDRGVDLLSKPFSVSALAGRVREILDRDGRQRCARSRILVVDDEVLVRMLLADILAGERQIEEAATYAEAMGKLRSLGEEIAGAIIDLGLPDRSGEELVAAIRASRPNLPIILATGFAGDGVRARFADDARLVILTKPFDAEALADALARFGI
jgi:signal transduction histidine kinase/CheY-like chemotaxis protein